MSKETLKKQLVDYLMDENLDTLTRIRIIENKFKKMWDSPDFDEEDEKRISKSNEWGSELKEQWGKLSLIMKLFKDFNLDEGRNSQMFKESKVGGDCFYWVDNYEVKIDDRNLSKNQYHPLDGEGFENLHRDLTELETI
jgi:hypothetical protein